MYYELEDVINDGMSLEKQIRSGYIEYSRGRLF